MCIIVHKPSGIDFPQNNILENCFVNNPDGIGIAWKNGNNLEYIKGYFDFDDFTRDLQTLYKHLSKDAEVTYHFRIATSGGIDDKHCHPFPITNNFKEMEFTCGKVSSLLFHNGVIGQGTKKQSDTELFIKDKIYGNEEKVKDILAKEQYQRFVYMSDKSDTVVSGDFIEENGILYSNDSYIKSRWNTYNYGSYDEDELYYLIQDMADYAEKCHISDNLRQAILHCQDMAEVELGYFNFYHDKEEDKLFRD